MYDEIEKLTRTKEVLEKIACGTNPISGGEIEKESFIYDENVNGALVYAIYKLNKLIGWEKNKSYKNILNFVISKDEIEKIKLPNKNIGVNEFAKYINEVVDTNKSKKITGVEINKKLKQMGILSEEEGNKKTIINQDSIKYGIEVEKRKFKGNEYDSIVFNEAGKKFLLENLIKIMEYSA